MGLIIDLIQHKHTVLQAQPKATNVQIDTVKSLTKHCGET